MRSISITRLLILIAAIATTVHNADSSNSRGLLRTLFAVNDVIRDVETRPHVLPVQKAGDKVSVQVGLALVNIRKLNFDQDTLTTTMWIITEWNDPSMSWKPVNYGGTKQISVPVSKIWSPDIIVFNDQSQVWGSTGRHALATVDYEGNVRWVAAASLETHCDLEPKAATHECSIRIGSWTHTSSLVDFNQQGVRKNVTVVDQTTNKTATAEAYISNAGIDTTSYLSGKRWTIESSSVEKHEMAYQWIPESGGSGTVTELEFKIRFSETRVGLGRLSACGQ